MLIFDLDEKIGRKQRVAVIGSCRVRNPLMLKGRGMPEIKWIVTKPPLTHSFVEATQLMRHVQGEIVIPEAFVPFIFDGPKATEPADYPANVLASVDTFLVEMCDAKQLVHRDFAFQNNYFARNFVQQHGAQLLPWYRALSRSKKPGKEVIDSTIAAFRMANVEPPARLKELLERTQVVLPDDKTIAADAKTMVAGRPKRWIFVSHFADPADNSAVMNDRRRLAHGIAAAAAEVGAEFFNPTSFIERYGRKVVMRGDGSDIYEYAHEFVSTVGETLLAVIRNRDVTVMPKNARIAAVPPSAVAVEADVKQKQPKVSAAKSGKKVGDGSKPKPAGSSKPASLPSGQAGDRVNKLLLDVMQDRYERLGLEHSGLYEHFKRQLDAGALVRHGDMKLASMLAGHALRYDQYVVLRSGIGSLPILLAIEGLNVLALEPNPHRLDAVKAAVARLRSTRPSVGALIAVEGDVAPAEQGAIRTTVAIATGLTVPDAKVAETMASLVGFDALIVAPDKFLSARPTPADVEDGIALIRRAGFDVTETLSRNLTLFTRQRALSGTTFADIVPREGIVRGSVKSRRR